MDSELTWWAPIVLQLSAAAASIAVAAASEFARRKWGIEVSEKTRSAIHTALINGLVAGLQKGLDKQALFDYAVKYASTFSTGSMEVAKKTALKQGGDVSQIAAALLPEAKRKLSEAMK